MSELRIGAAVEATDGGVGKLRLLVVDPVVNRVVHVVVDHRAIPARFVASCSWDSVELEIDRQTLDALPHVDLGHHEQTIAPGEEPDLGRLVDDEQVPLVVIGSSFPVLAVDGTSVGGADEWWVRDDDLTQLSHVVILRHGGLKLDRYVVVPSTHFRLDPAPQLDLGLSEVDLDALGHEPVLPGVHLSSLETGIDLSWWTPREPDEAVAQARIVVNDMDRS